MALMTNLNTKKEAEVIPSKPNQPTYYYDGFLKSEFYGDKTHFCDAKFERSSLLKPL